MRWRRTLIVTQRRGRGIEGAATNLWPSNVAGQKIEGISAWLDSRVKPGRHLVDAQTAYLQGQAIAATQAKI